MKEVTQTQAEQRNDQKSALRASIMELLKWDDSQYANFVYDQGMAYLRAYIPIIKREDQEDSAGLATQNYWIDLMSCTKVFWQWWTNHWMNREEYFLDTVDFNLSLEELTRLYKEHHDGDGLAEEVHPHRAVLETTYSQMIKEIMKE